MLCIPLLDPTVGLDCYVVHAGCRLFNIDVPLLTLSLINLQGIIPNLFSRDEEIGKLWAFHSEILAFDQNPVI